MLRHGCRTPPLPLAAPGQRPPRYPPSCLSSNAAAEEGKRRKTHWTHWFDPNGQVRLLGRQCSEGCGVSHYVAAGTRAAASSLATLPGRYDCI